jgi:hypothetical protein
MSTPTQRGGNGFARAGNTHQSFTWNGAYGYEWVPETGLYHVGAREYDPHAARRLQRNPIDAASVNPKLQCKGRMGAWTRHRAVPCAHWAIAGYRVGGGTRVVRNPPD